MAVNLGRSQQQHNNDVDDDDDDDDIVHPLGIPLSACQRSHLVRSWHARPPSLVQGIFHAVSTKQPSPCTRSSISTSHMLLSQATPKLEDTSPTFLWVWSACPLKALYKL